MSRHGSADSLTQQRRDRDRAAEWKRSRLLCLHVETAAAIVGLCELVVVALMLSSAALMLHRWRLWEAVEMSDAERLAAALPSTTNNPLLATSFLPQVSTVKQTTAHSHWDEAWTEFILCLHVAYCSVWLAAMFVYALAFRYYHSYMVVPNLAMLFASVIVTIIVIVSLLVFICDVDTEYRDDDYEEMIMIYAIAFLFFWWLCCMIMIVAVWKFYKWLLWDETTTVVVPRSRDPYYDNNAGRY